jgi:hypothetical protein
MAVNLVNYFWSSAQRCIQWLAPDVLVWGSRLFRIRLCKCVVNCFCFRHFLIYYRLAICRIQALLGYCVTPSNYELSWSSVSRIRAIQTSLAWWRRLHNVQCSVQYRSMTIEARFEIWRVTTRLRCHWSTNNSCRAARLCRINTRG